MGTRALDDLSSELRPLIFQVLARLLERQIPVMIVNTLRTMEEHRANLAAGTSQAMLSKHLPRTLRGYMGGDDLYKADAIDLCPYAVWSEHGPVKLNWDATDPGFAAIGQEGEKLGLRWGGRWRTLVDPGHLELPLPSPETQPRPV